MNTTTTEQFYAERDAESVINRELDKAAHGHSIAKMVRWHIWDKIENRKIDQHRYEVY